MKAVVYWPLLLLLAGCSAFSGKDNADPPSELIELEPELRIEEVWDAGFEDADEAMLKLMPVISEGILYVAEPSGEVFALDPETGDRRWSVDTESPLSGGPGVAEGSIALGTLEAELILLNSEDGAERWRRRVSSEVLSSPVVNDNKVVCRTTDGGVAVYAVENGDKRWAYDRSVPVLTLRGDSSPMVNDYQVLAGFAGGKLVGLSLESGLVNWEATISTPKGRTELERVVDIDADPVLVEGTLYVTSYQGDVAAVSESSGVVLWRRNISSHAGLDANWRQVFITDDEDHVWSLDATNGATLWQQKKLHARKLSAPAMVDDKIVVGDFDGYLHWLSQEDGRQLARIRVSGDAIRLKPLVMGDIVYVLDEGGNLSALKARPIETEIP
ncbi:MAG: outer membrane protein assembly factor BamB [Candidatus Thiodiazotropha sp.]|nr:outer membrane protein assembly factor BamB [Candidatus Thiodiazotropha taylori]MBT3057948.1 outer membrane protein assembly factor BamB [Candidatus Thiodiazotropha sp. (ex Lucina pensylvanica)]MBV2094222.1 outer membrane protein assembly factor BamB [Candidatus Thiodiazotropha sp. (ex Codakia orbicularis)]PUB77834.1 MAG: outer membrane protein assembly factor BamB [gamma proteobacterium symbiont of Ctena orbiculata]MBT3061949.1 outer membrane protein assembly factor BamB [Candidatus Thiodia